MSKQSNQKFRKELEKKVLSTNSIDSDDSVNSIKKEEDEYVSGDFRAPSTPSASSKSNNS